MSVSKKQNRANRENAQKSTGPTTNEGKQTSSRNAVKHGLYSEQIVIRTANLIESEDEYNDLIESLYDELKPKTAMQECLVKKIAACLWRSRRAIAAETAHITRQIEKVGSDGPSRYMLEQIYGRERDLDTDPVSTDAFENIFRNLITIRSIPHFAGSYDVSKYEMRLDRAMMRAYTLLRMLQSPSKSKNKENKTNNHSADPESGHESEPQPKPNPETDPIPEPESQSESTPETKPESEQQPKPKRKPEPKSIPKSQSKTKSSRKNNHNHPANENDNGDNYHNHDNNQNTATENLTHKSGTTTKSAKTKSSSKTPLPPMTANEIPTPPADNQGNYAVSGHRTRHPAVAVATADKNGMAKSPSPPPGTAGIPTLCTVVSGPDFDSGRNCDLTLNVYKKRGNEPISL